MRSFGIAVVVAVSVALAVPLAVRASTDPVMVPIRHFRDGFDTNDIALARTAFVKAGITILDEVPPHAWSGSGAVDRWLSDLAAHDTRMGVTDGSVDFGKPLVESASGTTGYVVVPAEYRYKQRGARMREPATMTFALKKIGGVWLISGWAWNGSVPRSGP